jgi:uncharacterized membrane protein
MVYVSKLLIIILSVIFSLTSQAHAYLDPNAGGFFLQVIIPIVFGAAAAVTVFWRRLVGKVKIAFDRLMGRSRPKSEDD